MASRLRSFWTVLAVIVGLLPGMAVWAYAAAAAPASAQPQHRHHQRHHRRLRARRHDRRRHRHRHRDARASASRVAQRGHHPNGATTTTTVITGPSARAGTSTTRTTTSTTTPPTSSTSTTTSASTTSVATGSNSTLIWDDEFNGPAGAAPDPTKWQVITSPSGSYNNDLECYTNSPSNVELDGQGHLAITARQGSGSCPYTSGRLQTNGLFATTYGTLEARIHLPAGQGLWPTFWALGSNRYSAGWPECGEIDAMENLGSDPFTNYGSIHGPQGTLAYGYSTAYRSPVSLAKGFHTYAVTWTSTSISYSVDGVTYAKYTPATLSAGQSWVFNQPFYLLLNLAVGGDWAGPPNSSTHFPATMLVDWVRVYS
jgi:beta-glucanase (GH16 family)